MNQAGGRGTVAIEEVETPVPGTAGNPTIPNPARVHDAPSAGHEAMPVRATFRGENGDARSEPLSPWDFPVLATCGACGRMLRKADSVLSDWEHVAESE